MILMIGISNLLVILIGGNLYINGKIELGVNSLYGISLNLGLLKQINDTDYFKNAKYGISFKNLI